MILEQEKSNSLRNRGEPVRMRRAKSWDLEIENLFRYQLAGYRDRIEYEEKYGETEFWPEVPMIKVLRAKKTG
jgi:hypothetical protein